MPVGCGRAPACGKNTVGHPLCMLLLQCCHTNVRERFRPTPSPFFVFSYSFLWTRCPDSWTLQRAQIVQSPIAFAAVHSFWHRQVVPLILSLLPPFHPSGLVCGQQRLRLCARLPLGLFGGKSGDDLHLSLHGGSFCGDCMHTHPESCECDLLFESFYLFGQIFVQFSFIFEGPPCSHRCDVHVHRCGFASSGIGTVTGEWRYLFKALFVVGVHLVINFIESCSNIAFESSNMGFGSRPASSRYPTLAYSNSPTEGRRVRKFFKVIGDGGNDAAHHSHRAVRFLWSMRPLLSSIRWIPLSSSLRVPEFDCWHPGTIPLFTVVMNVPFKRSMVAIP